MDAERKEEEMRSARKWLIVLTCMAMWSGSAEAFTSKEKDTVTVSASGVTETTTFDATQVVTQGTADTPATLSFGDGGNDFRDSGEAIKVVVDTNVAANRLIIYTNNLGAEASPKACLDTSKGIDSGGLVGSSDCAQTVPLVWGVTDANGDYTFTPRPLPDVGASNAVFVTDRAHVASFTALGSALDNVALERCADEVDVTNTAGDGLYPQFFGVPGQNLDLCRQDTKAKVPEAEELSKNIAVVGFDFLGTAGKAPNVPASSGSIDVTSPIYVPVAADFRKARAQNYTTNTLTIELVTQ